MSIYDTHKPAASEGGGLYLKIKDGETVKLRIASEPAIFESVPKEGDENARISTRYGWIVYNQDAKAAQIMQQSATFFKSIAALAQDSEWGDPKDYDVKVSRQGSSFNDTTYTVTPSANREPLDSKARAAVEAINLLEKLNASPFSQRVMWLSDFDKLAAEAEKGTDHSREVEAVAAVGDAKQDIVIEDIGDGEVNLDDIPF